MLIEDAISKTRNSHGLVFTHADWITCEVFTAFHIFHGKVIKFIIHNTTNGNWITIDSHEQKTVPFIDVSGSEFANDEWMVISLPKESETPRP